MDAADLARIRFVTSRYRELQGLRHLAVIPAVLLVFWLYPNLSPLRDMGPVEAVVGLLLSIAPVVAGSAAQPFFDRYYARRFGHVATSALTRRDTLARTALIVGGLTIDSWGAGNPRCTATLVAVALVSLHIVVRDWPWRASYIASVVVCLGMVWIDGAPVSSGDHPILVMRLPLTIAIGTYVVAAYLDHRLLANALPPNPEASEAQAVPDHADTF